MLYVSVRTIWNEETSCSVSLSGVAFIRFLHDWIFFGLFSFNLFQSFDLTNLIVLDDRDLALSSFFLLLKVFYECTVCCMAMNV